MDVKLRPMRNDEFADWLPQMRDDYARSMIEEGGVSPESASQRAAAQTQTWRLPPARQSAGMTAQSMCTLGKAAYWLNPMV